MSGAMCKAGLAVLLCGCLAAACSDESVDRARAKTQELVDKGFELYKQQREEVAESLSETLAEVRQRTAELRAAAARETGEAREALQQKLAKLEPYERKLEEQLAKAKTASQETWVAVKEEARELQQRTRKAWEAFREEP